MKKKLSVLLAVLLCVGLMAGCGQSTDTQDDKEDTKQEQVDNQDNADKADDAGDTEGAASDLVTKEIVLSGTYYSGQVQVTLTIYPDGTAHMEANGNESEGTWEEGEGDIAIVAHLKGDQDTDIEISEEDGVYTAPFNVVPGMVLSGR